MHKMQEKNVLLCIFMQNACIIYIKDVYLLMHSIKMLYFNKENTKIKRWIEITKHLTQKELHINNERG